MLATASAPAAVPVAGISAGRFFLGEVAYTLIVAPQDEGELVGNAWGPRKKITGALGPADGLANTQAMLVAGNPLAKWARALRIDGHDDWYLPSRLELFTAWIALRDTDHFAKDWYWTSTQYAGYDDCAWLQLFGNGLQLFSHKASDCRARAVRRVAIDQFAHSAISAAA